MSAAFPVLGCAVLPETYVGPDSLGPDSLYRDGCVLVRVCLTLGFNCWFELPSEYIDWRTGTLKRAGGEAGVVAGVPNGST